MNEDTIQELVEYYFNETANLMDRRIGELLRKSVDQNGCIDETKLTKAELRDIAEAALSKIQTSIMRAQVAEAIGDMALTNAGLWNEE